MSQGEIEEATGLPSWSSQQQQQRQEKPAWEREDLETGDRDKNVPPSFVSVAVRLGLVRFEEGGG